jgi:nucleotide-binding universal stress UspA family protein
VRFAPDDTGDLHDEHRIRFRPVHEKNGLVPRGPSDLAAEDPSRHPRDEADPRSSPRGDIVTRVLLATDGRPSAWAGANLLAELADPSRVEVAILSTADPRIETPDHFVQDLLGETERILGVAGLSVHTLRRDDDPATAVEKEAAGDAFDLVVLGAGNHHWAGEIVLGSVTSQVLRNVTQPILVVHRCPRHRPLRVLVGADGSPAAEHAIATLTRITDPDRVDVSVRTVTRVPEIVIRGHATVPAASELAATGHETEANAHLERALERLRDEGFHARGSIGRGWPASDLTAEAKAEDADLVVVGARGAGVLDQQALGSVSAHVCRHSAAALIAHAEIPSAAGPAWGGPGDRSAEGRSPPRQGAPP